MLKSLNCEGKIAFLIDSPIQLYNAIQYILSNELKGKTDAFIQVKFKNADVLIKALKQTEIFKNIYLLAQDKNGILKHLGILNALLFPKLYMYFVHGLNFWKINYNKIFVAYSTKTFDFIIAASGCKQIIGYEDGIGSYLGDPFRDNYRKRYLFLRRILGYDYHVLVIYLNNPSFYSGIKERMVDSIARGITSNDTELLYNIFHYKRSDLYIQNRIIYLNQSITHIKGYYEYEKKVLSILKKNVKTGLLLRLHPREKRIQLYEDFTIDMDGNMWEILCKEDINDEHVLIGYFSTAQFMPKMINDCEPYLIFTFELYEQPKKCIYDNYLKLLDVIKESYRNKAKISIPKTIDEYRDILLRLNI